MQMSNAKRFLSAVLALIMALSMFSCLGTVFASAGLADNTAVTEQKNGDDTWVGYRTAESDWGAVTESTFAAYNAAYQDYENGFGVKSWDELEEEYGDTPFFYMGVEIYEQVEEEGENTLEDDDGNLWELTDHYVQPGQTLKARVYWKTNVYIQSGIGAFYATRTFFDMSGEDSSTNRDSTYWSSSTDKSGIGLSSSGVANKTPTALNSDANSILTSDAANKIVITAKPCMSVSTLTTANTGLSTALIQKLEYVNILMTIGDANYGAGTASTDDEWLLDWNFMVRTESEPYQKTTKTKGSTATWVSAHTDNINPFADGGVNGGLIGEIGVPYNFSKDYNTKGTYYMYCFLNEEDGTADSDVTDAEYTFTQGVIYDVRDTNHVFIIGEPSDEPVSGDTYTAKLMNGTTTVSTQADLADGAAIDLSPVASKTGATFMGWSTDGTAAGIVSSATINGADVTLYAVFGYTATFVANGETISTSTVAEGTVPTAPAVTPPAGYTFSNVWSPALAAITADTTYTAQFTGEDHTITYQYEDGSTFDTVHYATGAVVAEHAGPTKQGSSFSSWTYSPALGAGNTMPANDVIATPNYGTSSYTLTVDLNDGSATTTQEVLYGTNIATLLGTPTRTGYTFAGWSGDATMPAAAMTVTAQWTANKYDATFVISYNGTTTTYTTVEDVEFGTEITMPDLPSENGYSFSAWAPSGTTMDAEGKTYTTTKTANSYTMIYKNQGGTTIGQTVQAFGEVINFATAPTITGATFTGWTDEEGNFVAAANVGTATVPSKSTTWTATYEGNSHTLTMTVDGSSTTATVAYGANILANVTAPEAADGYEFDGWYTNEACSTKVKSSDTMPDADYTVYGTMKAKNYTLTYVLNNGSDDIITTVAFGANLSAPSDPTKRGYTFAGWSEATPSTMPSHDVTITAQWTAIPYTIEFYSEGTLVVSKEYTYGDTIEYPAVSSEGSSLEGWDYDNDGVADTEITVMPDYNVTARAVWGVLKYTITYWVRETESGTYTKYTSDKYDFNEAVTIKDLKAQTGWTYTSWAESNGTVLSITNMPARDIDVYSTGTKNVYHDKWTDSTGTVVYEADVAYGDAIPDVTVPHVDGMTGEYWYPIVTTQPDYAVDFEYRSTAGSADYTIVTRIEKVDGTGYDETRETVTSTTGKTVTATSGQTTKTGFTLDPASVTTITVKGDNTSELVLIFNRNDVNLTVVDASGTNTTTVKYGATIPTLTAADMEGNEFVKWTWTRENGATVTYTDGMTMPQYALIATASYSPKTYNVIYTVDGEEYKTVAVTYGAAVKAEAEPSKTGYTFSGWTGLEDITTMPAHDVNVTGTYTVNIYNLKFVVDGTAVVDKNVAYGTELASYKPANPSIEGRTFVAWNPSVPTTMPAGDLTITAEFATDKHTATFKDGETIYKSYAVAFGEDIVAPADPSKTGYTFNGWDQEPGTMGTTDMVFNATWTANNYNAVFYAVDGDTTAYETVADVAFNTTFNAPEKNPERTAYNFVGWKLAGTTETVSFPYTMNAEGLTFVGVWSQDTTSCLVQSVALTADSHPYYARGAAYYDVTLLKGISAEKVYIYDGSKTITFSKASFELNGAQSSGVINIKTNDDGCEVWTVELVLAAATDTYKAYCLTDAGYTNTDTALDFSVAYDEKTDDVIKSEFSSYAISDTQVVRGNYLTWTFVTSTDVTWIKLVGTYTADGASKTLTTLYKYDTTNSNVTVTDNGTTRTWAISMRFTYSTDDLTVSEAWDVYYRVGVNTDYYKANTEAINVTVGYTAAALVPATVGYDKYTLVSATPSATSIAVNTYGTITIVTTDDCSKVRISVNGKNATYQTTTAKNVSYADADGLRTWTINYKFTASGSNEYSVTARGTAWGTAQTFTVVAS